MIIKTKLIPKGFQAISLWPFILVLPEHSSNTGLIEHELVHYREQAWVAPIWWCKYIFSKSFRLAAEVRAYKRQIAVGGITKESAVLMLLQYNLNISYSEALEQFYVS